MKLPLPLILAVVVLQAACGGHSHRTIEARTALDERAPQRALKLYNEELEVETAKDVPSDIGGDNSLLLLDRSMILQQLGDHQLSSRDLELADKQIEILDLNRGTTDEIGRYLYSDDTGPYRAPAYEKLMINTMNMVNYLGRGDLSGARVEARRLAVMQKYLKENESPEAALLSAGSYLAGFIFERSGDSQSALRYYDEALQHEQFNSLQGPIAALSKKASYRTQRIEDAISAGEEEAQGYSDDDATVLLVLNYGRVPAKKSLRIPVGLALTYAAGGISPEQHRQANHLAAQGLVTWINFPSLPKPTAVYQTPKVQVGKSQAALDSVKVDALVVSSWKKSRGKVIASAITRMITRVLAGEAARQAAGKGTEGLLLSLATQATLTAVDTPDTRCWATLPARIAIGRVRVPAGKQTVTLNVRGQRQIEELDLKPGGWAAINITILR